MSDQKASCGSWADSVSQRLGARVGWAARCLIEDWLRKGPPDITVGPVEQEALEVGFPLFKAHLAQMAETAEKQWQDICSRPFPNIPLVNTPGQRSVTDTAFTGNASHEAKVLLNYASFCNRWPPPCNPRQTIPAKWFAEAMEYHDFYLNAKLDPINPNTIGAAMSQHIIAAIVPLFMNHYSGKGPASGMRKPPESQQESQSVLEWEAAVTARLAHSFSVALGIHNK